MWTKTYSLCAVLVLSLTGCHGPPAPAGKFAGTYPIRVVCTTGMVADLVRNVGGSQVSVEQIMGPDVDPHLYKATPGDMRKITRADAVFYSGLHLEGKMTDVLKMPRRMPCIAVAEKIDRDKVLTSKESIPDPHAWFDVSMWSQAAGAIRDTLVSFDPTHADDYRQRAEKYQTELAKLHDYARERIGSIPQKQRVLVTSHDAFRYFGRAYGIEVRGIQGISTESEASVKDINDLVRFLTERQVKAVFVESSVNPRNMQALLEGCRAANHEVVLGGELFSDAMGQEGTPGGTYIGMIRHNVDTIVQALR